MERNNYPKFLIMLTGSFLVIYGVTFLSVHLFDHVYLMKAMIPHHSSAILTSERAAISDPEVKELAREIIRSQEEEIARMKYLLTRLEK